MTPLKQHPLSTFKTALLVLRERRTSQPFGPAWWLASYTCSVFSEASLEAGTFSFSHLGGSAEREAQLSAPVTATREHWICFHVMLGTGLPEGGESGDHGQRKRRKMEIEMGKYNAHS